MAKYRCIKGIGWEESSFTEGKVYDGTVIYSADQGSGLRLIDNSGREQDIFVYQKDFVLVPFQEVEAKNLPKEITVTIPVDALIFLTQNGYEVRVNAKL